MIGIILLEIGCVTLRKFLPIFFSFYFKYLNRGISNHPLEKNNKGVVAVGWWFGPFFQPQNFGKLQNISIHLTEILFKRDSLFRTKLCLHKGE